ncbi:MAG: putative cytosolic protein [Alphaproteobacteria bacterium]|nr:putative cytosolic protein [Alphaproteobacteria bacterium]
MAGHSKFKNIMFRKGKQDSKKAKVFNKISREISVAVRQGGEDQNSNPRLRAAILAARAANMTNDRVKSAIKSGSDVAGELAEEIRYEGYGPGGIALIIEALTDNRQRTAPEIRSTMSKNGGAMGEMNSVAFQFKRVGQILYPAKTVDSDAMFEAALEAGADNVESDEEYHDITTTIEDYAAALETLSEKFGSPEESGFIWVPNNTIEVTGDNAAALVKLINALEDLDDVQQVFGNYEIADDMMEKLSA